MQTYEKQKNNNLLTIESINFYNKERSLSYIYLNKSTTI